MSDIKRMGDLGDLFLHINEETSKIMMVGIDVCNINEESYRIFYCNIEYHKWEFKKAYTQGWNKPESIVSKTLRSST